MTQLRNVTLMAISGSEDPVSFTNHLRALIHSMSNGKLVFGKVKILSPIKPVDVPEPIEYVQIPVLSYAGYNNFSIRELNNYVDTDYVLNVQNDGFVTHPELWSDSFLQYDYVGAPWHDSAHYEHVRVGNSGFCLRSKAFLRVAQQYCPTHNFNDDHLMCVTYRSLFLKHGMKFAPLEVASKFSFESQLSDYPNSVETSFGAHGKNTYMQNIVDSWGTL